MSILAVHAKLKPGEELTFELPAGATLADLLAAMDGRIGDRLPTQFWDRETRQFNRQILFVVDDSQTRDLATPLRDGSTVMAFVPIGGG
ncbi:MAG: MoaD/ThiS family protein [Chloroflexota bacterium]|nr:MoaD/ThiS family protein [Chloroflexota bacterium]